MRAYFFGNMYLSSIQQGIQAGHVIAEMFVKYRPLVSEDYEIVNNPYDRMLNDWAANHKVMILLNGGYGENLRELNAFFEGTLDEPGVTRLSEVYDNYSPYPFAFFEESDEALDGAMTSFGVILPPKIYEGARLMQKTMRLPRDMDVRQLFENEGILVFSDGEEVPYNKWEIELMQRLNTFRLAQ